jgi:hypothetical protein
LIISGLVIRDHYRLIDERLLLNLNEKDVEIEHLRTVIVGINQKNEVTNDLRTENQQLRAEI